MRTFIEDQEIILKVVPASDEDVEKLMEMLKERGVIRFPVIISISHSKVSEYIKCERDNICQIKIGGKSHVQG